MKAGVTVVSPCLLCSTEENLLLNKQHISSPVLNTVMKAVKLAVDLKLTVRAQHQVKQNSVNACTAVHTSMMIVMQTTTRWKMTSSPLTNVILRDNFIRSFNLFQSVFLRVEDFALHCYQEIVYFGSKSSRQPLLCRRHFVDLPQRPWHKFFIQTCKL